MRDTLLSSRNTLLGTMTYLALATSLHAQTKPLKTKADSVRADSIRADSVKVAKKKAAAAAAAKV